MSALTGLRLLGGSKLSEFRTRGLKVSVDTTHIAEIDFADNNIPKEDQERIARHLKHILRAEGDIVEGKFRLREIIDGWEVIFTHHVENESYVVLILGYGKKGKMESTLKLVMRAGLEQFAPGARVLFEGKERK